MEGFEDYIKKHLKERNESIPCYKEEVNLLEAKIKNAKQKEKIYLGRECFLLYQVKEENWIKEQMKEIYNNIASSEEKFFTSEEKKSLYKVFPFYVKYETLFKGKAKYNQIYNLFEQNYSLDLDYAVGILDTLENTSEEIFEYYRGLQLLLKKLVSELLKVGREFKIPNDLNKDSFLKLSYVLLKGIDLGYLDEEYEVVGIESYNRYLSK